MPHTFPLTFQDEATHRTVTAVLVPADPISRRTVPRGVKASLWDGGRQRPLPDRLVRNLSGHLVLLDRPLGGDYTFRIDPRPAGYRGPIELTLNPQRDGVRHIVWLQPRPDTAFDAGTTLVRGVVQQDPPTGSPPGPPKVPAASVLISAEPEAAHVAVEAMSDERGAFVLALPSLRRMVGDGDEPVLTHFRFVAGARVVEFHKFLTEGREHIFSEAIDLDGANDPVFTSEAPGDA